MPWPSELWHCAVKSGSTANGYTGLFYGFEDVTWRFSRWSCWLFRSYQMWLSVRGWVYLDVSYGLLNIFCSSFSFSSFSCCCASSNEILRVSKMANVATPPTSIQDVPSYNLGGDTDFVDFLRSPYKCLVSSSSCAVIFSSTFVYIHQCLLNIQLYVIPFEWWPLLFNTPRYE